MADDVTGLLLIGGRSGVGKSAVAAELHHLLTAADVVHAVIEGDNLDLAHPPPWEHGVAEANLRAMWATYHRLGYRRLVYSNTVSVLEAEALVGAVGGAVHLVAVLLTADDATAGERLGRRELGSGRDVHRARSRARAAELDARAGPSVHRVPTDGRTVADVAAEVLELTGWTRPT